MGIGGGWRSIFAGAAGWLAAFACVAAEPSPASPVSADPLGAGGILNVFLSLLLVLVAIWGVAWLTRRMSLFQAPAGGALRMLGALAVGQRERVVLVQVGETQLLLGVAPGAVRMLHVLDKPVEVSPVAGEGFAERLAQVMGKRSADSARESMK